MNAFSPEKSQEQGILDAKPVLLWQEAIDRVRRSVLDDDDAGLLEQDAELKRLLTGPHREIRRGLPQLRLYSSLADWKRNQVFVPPFSDAQTARVQNWELDQYCADIAYRRAFIDYAVERYPDRRGFRVFKRILGTVSNKKARFKLTKADVQVHRRPGATMTIVGFGGVNGGFVGTGWSLFERAIAEPANANLIILRDENMRNYLGSGPINGLAEGRPG
jgi:hypothetical protein